MKKSSIVIAVLGAALVVSNVAWAFNAVDVAITRSFERESHSSESDALNRAIAVIPVAASSKAEIVAAARLKGGSIDEFEKDGMTWVGNLGLQFNANGKLTKACAVSCGE